MTEADMVDIARDGIWTMIKVAAPALLAGLVVGVAVALLQSVTQLQEATLTFVPKVLTVFMVLVLVLLVLRAMRFTMRQSATTVQRLRPLLLPPLQRRLLPALRAAALVLST